jgi:hypothetical protein
MLSDEPKQSVALAVVQVSVEEFPLVIVEGEAFNVTVGTASGVGGWQVNPSKAPSLLPAALELCTHQVYAWPGMTSAE